MIFQLQISSIGVRDDFGLSLFDMGNIKLVDDGFVDFKLVIANGDFNLRGDMIVGKFLLFL